MKKSDPYYLTWPEVVMAKAYCQRYFDLKSRYELLDGRKGLSYDDDGVRSGVSDPTFVTAEKRRTLYEKIQTIEGACYFASPNLWFYILLYVADPKMDFGKLREKGFPLNQNILRQLARKAYWKIAQEI